jgi:hypothetical protein
LILRDGLFRKSQRGGYPTGAEMGFHRKDTRSVPIGDAN